ncbi:MAG: GDSL-type esterase/lipase family protein [Myxococcota bacterium]|nr:GDSL-type esterase/lipase family protein [Myxococcota bacterium]
MERSSIIPSMSDADKPMRKLSSIRTREFSPMRKAVFAFMALVAFFVLAELLLFGVGKVVYYQKVSRLNPQRDAAAGETFRIVAFGDSVTAGQGTAPEYSYPRQLESLLQENNPDGRFEVINNGVYALNSSRTADLLPGWLKEFKPQLIVVMMGCNNAWNYRNSHLDELGLLEGDERSAFLTLLAKTRTYRFLRVLLKRQKRGFGIAEEQEHEPVLRGRMQISDSVSPAVDPTARTLERQRSLFRDEEALDKLLTYDLTAVMNAAAEYQTSLLIMSYPFRPPYQDHRGLTLGFAEEHNLMSVDNYAVFEQLKKKHRGLDLFSADRGHPNATGYRVVAAAIYEEMRQHSGDLGLQLAPTPDPLAEFKDPKYLAALYEEVRLSSERADADEYVFETLGHVAMEQGDMAAAEAAFLTAFERSGGAPQFYESLGNLYVRNRDWDKLDALKEKMLGLRGDRSDIDFLLQMFERESQAGRAGRPTRQVGGWGQGGGNSGPGEGPGGAGEVPGGPGEGPGGSGEPAQSPPSMEGAGGPEPGSLVQDPRPAEGAPPPGPAERPGSSRPVGGAGRPESEGDRGVPPGG